MNSGDSDYTISMTRLTVKIETPKPPMADKIKPARKPRSLFRYFLFAGIFIFTSLAVFSTQVLVSEQDTTSWLSRLPLFSQLKRLAESADKNLKGEDRDRINILLLGMGGKNHEGAYLTDTIILASLEPSTKKVALISLPRDLVIPMENAGWKKINNVNAFAEVNEPGSGGLATSQALADILNLPIDYYLRVDFDGFINVIDRIGGLKIYVENTLDDYSYPVMGREDAVPYESRFEHLHIDAGWQVMDGGLALKYARSRHAAGGEGSDFARARRQQKIITAAKDRLLTLNLLLRPSLIADLIAEVENHLSTNLKIWEVLKLWTIFKDITNDNITNRVLDNGPNGLLVDSVTADGAYVLEPRSGDFMEIQYLVHNIFANPPVEEASAVLKEKPTVEIRNGTWINGLASTIAMDIEKYGFTVVRVGNSSRQNFQKSVIYDLTYGVKAKSLEQLRSKMDANISYSLPDWLKEDIAAAVSNETNPVQPDFILVLGQEADATASGRENFSE
jgi:polyisoprenyl-teichoic acid--peptidoglycan teichoic acid transferase